MATQIAQVLEGALRQPDQTEQEAIRIDTPAWWRWLDAETTRSFAGRCQVLFAAVPRRLQPVCLPLALDHRAATRRVACCACRETHPRKSAAGQAQGAL